MLPSALRLLKFHMRVGGGGGKHRGRRGSHTHLVPRITVPSTLQGGLNSVLLISHPRRGKTMNPRLTQGSRQTACVWCRKEEGALLLLGSRRHPRGARDLPQRFTHVCEGEICWGKREGRKNRKQSLRAARPSPLSSSSPSASWWAANLTANLAAHSMSTLENQGTNAVGALESADGDPFQQWV